MYFRILIVALLAYSAVLEATEPATAADQGPHLSDDKGKRDRGEIPKVIDLSFTPPPELVDDFGKNKSLLTFQDGTPVKTSADWQRRRKEILDAWGSMTGSWPELVNKPKVQYLEQTRREHITQNRISVVV